MRFRRIALRIGLPLLGLLVLATGGWLWVRDSGLARVRYVDITGVTTSDGDRIRAALDEAARGMSTLHVREGALLDAARTFPSVAAIRTRADFPHRLVIHVVEQRPVAALDVPGSRRVPVTSAGVLLRGVEADRELPSVQLDRAALGPRVTDRRLLGALAVASAAPGPLLSRADRLDLEDRGVVVTMRDGPDLVFGNGGD